MLEIDFWISRALLLILDSLLEALAHFTSYISFEINKYHRSCCRAFFHPFVEWQRFLYKIGICNLLSGFCLLLTEWVMVRVYECMSVSVSAVIIVIYNSRSIHSVRVSYSARCLFHSIWFFIWLISIVSRSCQPHTHTLKYAHVHGTKHQYMFISFIWYVHAKKQPT